MALHKESSLHPPSKLLLSSLATTDLCAGVIVEPLIVIYWMSVVNKLTLEYLSFRRNGTVSNKLYLVFSVSLDTDCNKRRQTSRPVAGTEIQTSCKFKANLCDRGYPMG